MISAIVLINAERDKIVAVAEELASDPHVSEMFSVAGRHDLVALVRVRTNEELADVITQRFAQVEGITHTETLIAFRVYRHEDLDAGFAFGLESE